MPCKVCGEKLDKQGTDNTLFKHYLREHPIIAAKTWRCCIPKHIKDIPEIKEYRRARGWDE